MISDSTIDSDRETFISESKVETESSIVLGSSKESSGMVFGVSVGWGSVVGSGIGTCSTIFGEVIGGLDVTGI